MLSEICGRRRLLESGTQLMAWSTLVCVLGGRAIGCELFFRGCYWRQHLKVEFRKLKWKSIHFTIHPIDWPDSSQKVSSFFRAINFPKDRDNLLESDFFLFLRVLLHHRMQSIYCSESARLSNFLNQSAQNNTIQLHHKWALFLGGEENWLTQVWTQIVFLRGQTLLGSKKKLLRDNNKNKLPIVFGVACQTASFWEGGSAKNVCTYGNRAIWAG